MINHKTSRWWWKIQQIIARGCKPQPIDLDIQLVVQLVELPTSIDDYCGERGAGKGEPTERPP